MHRILVGLGAGGIGFEGMFDNRCYSRVYTSSSPLYSYWLECASKEDTTRVGAGVASR